MKKTDESRVEPRLNQLEAFTHSLIKLCVGDRVEIIPQDKSLPGCPDFSIPSIYLAIFVDGDFWHSGRGRRMNRVAIRYFAEGEHEKANFWHEKSKKNAKRDREVNKKLKEMGYKVVRLKEDRLNGYDPLGYVSRSIGLALFRVKDLRPKSK